MPKHAYAGHQSVGAPGFRTRFECISQVERNPCPATAPSLVVVVDGVGGGHGVVVYVAFVGSSAWLQVCEAISSIPVLSRVTSSHCKRDRAVHSGKSLLDRHVHILRVEGISQEETKSLPHPPRPPSRRAEREKERRREQEKKSNLKCGK